MAEIDYKNYKLLFVDDELQNLENLMFAFELDFTVITSSNAAEALDILNRENIAVVISDQRMPDVCGTKLLRTIKERHPKVVRMLITAYSDVEAAIDAINQGEVYRYIRKDLEIRDIEMIIKQAIQYYKMSEDLEKATEHLVKSEKLITIAEMAAGFGHEIANTVSGINLCIEAMARRVHVMELNDPQIDKLVAKIDQYGKRSAEIIKRLNGFAKPGHVEGVEMVDLHKVIDNSIEMSRDGFKMLLANTTVIKDMDEDLPKVEGNHMHFEGVFLNLIRNACQAMEGTGGTVIIKGRTDNGQVRIAVEDTGPGIPEEDVDKVLSAFYTTKKDGMGMGLYIIDHIIKTFGGRLELQSKIGKGSTFTVLLPAL